ncbi:MAG: hypothetical protein DRQ65_06640 [Gammaproteobacteria bacterium]|nr:MAG: hypothetical protein DRQ61_07145 [Gammaproteobacteria bacterium]RLA52809.1 MAG: hypothetical protein DRQ65_06640 [Gammaproteobacteria bacterium]
MSVLGNKDCVLTCFYPTLKERQRKERDSYPINVGLRIHRSLSWLNRAEQCENDNDAEFIFLWIAFNAAYADEFSSREFTATGTFRQFISKLDDLDKGGQLNDLVWSEFSSGIRVLLDNRFVFQGFWDFHSQKISEAEWRDRFSKAKKSANWALANRDTPALLVIIFSRLYTLRNQLIHGGATWNSQVNRDQVRDCANFLRKLVPLVIEIMMDNTAVLWGDPSYPVVE